MEIHSEILRFKTKGNADILNISPEVEASCVKSGFKEGVAHVFVKGSTAGITTIEYEPGLVADLKEYFDRTAPKGLPYSHNAMLHDDNGHAHIRATAMKQSFSFPIMGGRPVLGTYQQVILVDFDTRPRDREIVLQIIGVKD